MKKKILLVHLFTSLWFTALAGTNAVVTVKTNDLTVSLPGFWPSNAVSISAALQAIGFTGGSGTANFYDGTQFKTNPSGAIALYNIATSNLSGILSNANLSATVLTNSATGVTLGGNIMAATSTNFSGGLSGNVTGSQSATVVSSVGSASLPASQITGTINVTNFPAAALTNNEAAAVTFGTNVSTGGKYLSSVSGNFLDLNGSYGGNGAVALANNSWGQSINLDGNGNGIELVGNAFLFENSLLSTNPVLSLSDNNFVYHQNSDPSVDSSFVLYGTTSPNADYPEILDLIPDSLDLPYWNDELVARGNSNRYNIRLTALGGIVCNNVWHNYTNVSGRASYQADMGDRVIYCNPAAASCQITLPGLGILGQVLPGTTTTNWNPWTLGNGAPGDGHFGMTAYATIDYTVINLGSNTANTVAVCLADHASFTNCGTTNLIIPNQTAAHFVTDGATVICQFAPLIPPTPSVAAANGSAVNINLTSTTVGGTNNWTGDIAYPGTSISTLANGNNAGIVIGTNTYFRLSGPTAAFAICGIAGGWDGREITLENATGQTMTVANNSGVDPASTNRILTASSVDESSTANPWLVTLVYDGSQSRWIMKTGAGGPGAVNTLAGSAFGFSAVTAHDSTTNFFLNLSGAVYQKIVASGNVCFTSAVNGPGAVSIKVWPNGSDRLILWPKSYLMLNTNGLVDAGTNWSLTLTNGTRVAWISAVADIANPVNTNLVFQCVISP